MSPNSEHRKVPSRNNSGTGFCQIPDFFEEDRIAVDAHLEKLLPSEATQPTSIHQAMRYSVQAGGKRIRPILVLETARIFESDITPALHPACAIEFIHTYSLIHDDLPALDNDDLRRGKPTSHKKFGEATAILAGDALLTLAFEVVGAAPVDAERRVAMLTEIATAAGTINGMVGGQVADLEAEGKPVAKKMLEYIHRSKTAALIRASVTAGALCVGAPKSESRASSQIWRKHRLGVSGDRRYSRRRRIFHRARQNCGQRRRAAKSHISRRLWPRAFSRNRNRPCDPRHQ